MAREYSDKAATLELTLAPSTLTLSDDDSEKRIARSTIRVSFDIIG